MRFSQSSEISDTYLYGESYRSDMRTFRPFASFSITSIRGLFLPATISSTVDFGIPVRSDTWRRERFFLTMMFSSNIFMGIAFPNWWKILWKIKERSSERGIL